MSDDVTWVTESTPDDLLPINIWWPAVASPEGYERLAHKRPDMLARCLRACIAADYQDMWDKLLVSSFSEPVMCEDFETESTTGIILTQDLKLQRLLHAPFALWKEAKVSRNDHYRRDILAAVPDANDSLGRMSYLDSTWESHTTSRDLYGPYSFGPKLLYRDDPACLGAGEGAYDGLWAELSDVEFNVFVRDVIGLDHKVWKEKGEEGDRSGLIDSDDLYEALEADENL